VGPAEALHACGDGAGADQDDFTAFGAQAGNLAGPVGKGFDSEAFAVVGHEGAADLDDQSAGVTD
jgi:hypothetical protein